MKPSKFPAMALSTWRESFAENLNLKFYAAYIGRYYNYTDYARNKFGLRNSTTGVIELGFIAPLVVL